MNKLDIKNINDILNYSFIIESYQRGYRWTDNEVGILLEDLDNFKESLEINDRRKNNLKYLFQPIVVKRRESKYEIIDGQQRLTSIYIILKALNVGNLYGIEYVTRKGSQDFLESLGEEEASHNEENIDYYNMSSAYRLVVDKFKDESKKSIEDYIYLILNDINIIWYEVETESSIEIFTRINSGKIPLTNGELIKALLLKNEDEDIMLLERSKNWDEIEYFLQDDRVWNFIYGAKKSYETRIEYFFDLYCLENNDENIGYDEYRFSFLIINKILSEANDIKVKSKVIWEEIYNYYMIIKEWYMDKYTYNRIGYLIYLKQDLTSLLSKYKEMDKIKFKNYLDKKISVEFLKKGKSNSKEEALKLLNYGESSDKQSIRNVFLLFNILTMENLEEFKNKVAYRRFMFDKFKNEKWEIEHIHAINDRSEDEFEDIDSMDNLALLDKESNISIGNESFGEKRKAIINKDKRGDFILPATRNVFLKYYNEKADQDLTRWTDEDRQYYIKAIVDKLKFYLEVN